MEHNINRVFLAAFAVEQLCTLTGAITALAFGCDLAAAPAIQDVDRLPLGFVMASIERIEHLLEASVSLDELLTEIGHLGDALNVMVDALPPDWRR